MNMINLKPVLTLTRSEISRKDKSVRYFFFLCGQNFEFCKTNKDEYIDNGKKMIWSH